MRRRGLPALAGRGSRRTPFNKYLAETNFWWYYIGGVNQMPDPRYKTNAGSVFSLKYHLVWCPKYRKKLLTGELEARLKVLLYQKAEELKATIHALEIMPDHVHIFIESDPTFAPAQIAAQLKGFTSHELRKEFPWLKSRLPCMWSRSYYISSVGSVSESTVKRYIAAQKTHA